MRTKTQLIPRRPILLELDKKRQAIPQLSPKKQQLQSQKLTKLRRQSVVSMAAEFVMKTTMIVVKNVKKDLPGKRISMIKVSISAPKPILLETQRLPQILRYHSTSLLQQQSWQKRLKPKRQLSPTQSAKSRIVWYVMSLGLVVQNASLGSLSQDSSMNSSIL